MRLNRKGMVGFPVRLAITFLILSISLPIMLGMVGDFQEDLGTNSTTAETERLIDTISDTYYSGKGSVRNIDMKIDSNCYIIIGGEGSNAYSIGIFNEDVEVLRLYTEKPSVKMISSGDCLSGNFTLRCECVRDGLLCSVEVSVID